MKQRLLRAAAILVAAAFLLPGRVYGYSMEKGILMDGQTGRVLYEKNADEESLIASTTKIMTALVVCQQCNVLDRVRIPAQAVGVEGSSMYLKEGEILTVQELLYGLMLSSGNDAAVALAIYCGGTVEGFAQLMNDKARALGLEGTHFVNPHGLDASGHYSTARDLAVLASYAMDDPIFAQTVGTRTVRCGERTLTNHNKLLWQVEGAEGIKTGYTKAAGRILVSSACRDGRRLICVTINDGNDWLDHGNLYDWGFEQYTMEQILRPGQRLGTRLVWGESGTEVSLVTQEGFSYALQREEEPVVLLPESELAYPPVTAGQQAGVAYVCIDGDVVGSVPLVYGETVEESRKGEPTFFQRLFGGT